MTRLELYAMTMTNAIAYTNTMADTGTETDTFPNWHHEQVCDHAEDWDRQLTVADIMTGYLSKPLIHKSLNI